MVCVVFFLLAQAGFFEDPVYGAEGRGSDILMFTYEQVPDLIVTPCRIFMFKLDDIKHDIRGNRCTAAFWYPWLIFEGWLAALEESFLPLIARFGCNPEFGTWFSERIGTVKRE